VVSLNIRPISAPAWAAMEGLEDEELQEAIIDWFHENYEDPAENTPFESAEGGYQWIWGGPYDAREELETYFGDKVPEKVLEEVVRRPERNSLEWAPNNNLVYDEDQPDDDYANLQGSLDNLENALGEVRAVSSAIGGNNPPEAIGVPPYSTDDEAEIREVIALLRAPEPVLIANADQALKAAGLLNFHAEKIRKFFEGQGPKFADKFTEQLAKRSADALVIGATLALGVALHAVAEAAKHLLSFIASNPPI
jgi:hypothetical protein